MHLVDQLINTYINLLIDPPTVSVFHLFYHLFICWFLLLFFTSFKFRHGRRKVAMVGAYRWRRRVGQRLPGLAWCLAGHLW